MSTLLYDQYGDGPRKVWIVTFLVVILSLRTEVQVYVDLNPSGLSGANSVLSS